MDESVPPQLLAIGFVGLACGWSPDSLCGQIQIQTEDPLYLSVAIQSAKTKQMKWNYSKVTLIINYYRIYSDISRTRL